MTDDKFIDKDGRYWYPRHLRKIAIDAYYEHYLAQSDLRECYEKMKEREDDGTSEKDGEEVQD